MRRTLAFCLVAAALAAPALSAAQSVQFETEQTAAEANKASEQKALQKTAARLLGKTFWFEPNANAILKLEFLEAIPQHNESVLSATRKFRPTGVATFKVTRILSQKSPYGFGDEHFIEVEFGGGKMGYVKTLLGMIPSGFNIYEDRLPYDFEEFVYEEEPGVIRARVAAAKKAWEARGGVRIGMTKARVLKSNWGKPDHINRTVTRHGEREQWVYGDQYLYFENGVLTTIQD